MQTQQQTKPATIESTDDFFTCLWRDTEQWARTNDCIREFHQIFGNSPSEYPKARR